MSIWRTHPGDATLMLALDREASPWRRRVLEHHLNTCQPCRARLDALEQAAREATQICRDAALGDGVDTAALRLRLQRRMAELGTDWDRSLLFRLRKAARSVPASARLALAAAFLVLAVRLVQPDVRIRLSSGTDAESLPDSRFTPGAVSSVSVADLCSGGQPSRRVVSISVRQEILRNYQMDHAAPFEYELDYLVTPELGGIGNTRNLWPERYDSGAWNARVKDEIEVRLSRLVCDGVVDLRVAQRELADNWIDAYKKYFDTDRPIPLHADLQDDDEMVFEPDARTAPAQVNAEWFVRPLAVGSIEQWTPNDRFRIARAQPASWHPGMVEGVHFRAKY